MVMMQLKVVAICNAMEYPKHRPQNQTSTCMKYTTALLQILQTETVKQKVSKVFSIN